MTILLKAISDSDTTLMFSEAPLFPQDNGVIMIDSEIIFYTTIYMNTMYGCTRGARSTVAASHPVNSVISLVDFFDANEAGGTASGFTKIGTSVNLDADVTDITIANATNLTSFTFGASLIPSNTASYAIGSDTFRVHNIWTAGDLHFATGGRLILDDTNVSYIDGSAVTLGLNSSTDIRAFINSSEVLSIDSAFLTLEGILLATNNLTVGDNGPGGAGSSIFGNGASLVGIGTSGTEVARFDSDSTAGNTRFLLYDVDSGLVQRVKVTANDAVLGVTGRVLYIDNM